MGSAVDAEVLREVAQMADTMVAVADRPRQDATNPRVQQFAIALHRHAKGVKAAAAAWLQEQAHA